MRICQAQYLLISTDWEVSRIAFETGFGSLSRFYEAFKVVSGRTPRQYRLLSDMYLRSRPEVLSCGLISGALVLYNLRSLTLPLMGGGPRGFS